MGTDVMVRGGRMWRRVLGGTGVEIRLSAASVVSSVLVAVFTIDITGVAVKLTFPFAFQDQIMLSFACDQITRAFVVTPRILISRINIGSRT